MISGDELELSSDESHHCVNVLRNKLNDRVQIIDGKGSLFFCSISSIRRKIVRAEILDKKVFKKRPYRVHLAISPTKSHDRIDWLVEKTVELGVDEITFIKTSRTERKRVNIDRLRKIAISATKQSSQYFLPEVNDVTRFEDVFSAINEEYLFIGHLEETATNKYSIESTYKKHRDVCIAVGPEGDFSETEIDKAYDYGFKCISLGESTLRTETAGIYSVGCIKAINA